MAEDDLHDLFSSKSVHICAKKPQDKWVDRTLLKSKEKFFMEIILSSKYSWKHNRFSIVIVNICDYVRLEMMNDLSRVLVWCHWWTWTEVMYKDGQTFCLGFFIFLLHKIGSCSTLYFLCCYAITWVVWKQTVRENLILPIVMINVHLDFRGMQVFCVVLQKKRSDHPLV